MEFVVWWRCCPRLGGGGCYDSTLQFRQGVDGPPAPGAALGGATSRGWLVTVKIAHLTTSISTHLAPVAAATPSQPAAAGGSLLGISRGLERRREGSQALRRSSGLRRPAATRRPAAACGRLRRGALVAARRSAAAWWSVAERRCSGGAAVSSGGLQPWVAGIGPEAICFAHAYICTCMAVPRGR